MTDYNELIQEFRSMVFPWSPEDCTRIVKALEELQAERDGVVAVADSSSDNLPFVAVDFDGGTTFALTGENAGHWVEGGPTHVPMAQLKKVEQERDAALAVIEQVRSVAGLLRPWASSGEQITNLQRILDQSPASALAKVKADAWDECYFAAIDDQGQAALNLPTNPYREAAGA